MGGYVYMDCLFVHWSDDELGGEVSAASRSRIVQSLSLQFWRRRGPWHGSAPLEHSFHPSRCREKKCALVRDLRVTVFSPWRWPWLAVGSRTLPPPPPPPLPLTVPWSWRRWRAGRGRRRARVRMLLRGRAFGVVGGWAAQRAGGQWGPWGGGAASLSPPCWRWWTARPDGRPSRDWSAGCAAQPQSCQLRPGVRGRLQFGASTWSCKQTVKLDHETEWLQGPHLWPNVCLLHLYFIYKDLQWILTRKWIFIES